MTYEVRVAGRILGGVMEMPDCEGALEQVTRAVALELIRHHAITKCDFVRPHVFIWRRAANAALSEAADK